MKITGNGGIVDATGDVVEIICPCGASVRAREKRPGEAVVGISIGDEIRFGGFRISPPGVQCPKCRRMVIICEE